MAYNLQNWQSTFANPTSNVNRGILGSAFNTNPLTARGMNILGSNIAYGLPLAYASLASKLQKNIPESLQGVLSEDIFSQGAMGAGAGITPEIDETLRYGDTVTDTNYPGANRPLNTLDRNWQHQIRMQEIDRGNIDNRFSFPSFGIASIANKMFQPNTPEENFGRNYFNMDSSGRTYGNQADDLFARKNVVTAFGKGMGAAGQKRMDTIENTLRTKYGLTDAQIADIYAGSFDEEESGISTPLIQRLQNFKNQQNRYNKAFAAATGEGATTKKTVASGDGGDAPYGSTDTSGWSSPGYSTREGFTGTGGAPGTGQRGHHGNWAQGGRIGYREGLLVDENIEGPGFDENIEMASAPHPDEAWFGLWEDLSEKGIVPIEIETLNDFKNWIHNQNMDLGSIDEQDQGIASLV